MVDLAMDAMDQTPGNSWVPFFGVHQMMWRGRGEITCSSAFWMINPSTDWFQGKFTGHHVF